MTSLTFELLAQLLSPSEHIPKGNVFGRWPFEARKEIAVTVWALANQETCRQISNRFDNVKCVVVDWKGCKSSCGCSHRPYSVAKR